MLTARCGQESAGIFGAELLRGARFVHGRGGTVLFFLEGSCRGWPAQRVPARLVTLSADQLWCQVAFLSSGCQGAYPSVKEPATVQRAVGLQPILSQVDMSFCSRANPTAEVKLCDRLNLALRASYREVPVLRPLVQIIFGSTINAVHVGARVEMGVSTDRHYPSLAPQISVSSELWPTRCHPL